MPMQPDQFKAFEVFAASLKNELVSLREAVQKLNSDHNDATRNASEAAKEKWGEIPRIIASSGLGSGEDREAAKTEDKKKYTQQERLITWTKSAFIAAAVYALIAILQWQSMRQTYTQIQSQTEAAQQSAYAACINAQIARRTLLEVRSGQSDSHSAAVGSVTQAITLARTEAAMLLIRMESAISPQGPNQIPKSEMIMAPKNFAYVNIGPSIAKNVHIKFVVQVLPHNFEPSSFDKGVHFDHVSNDIVPPGMRYETVIRYLDKDGKIIGPRLSDRQLQDLLSAKSYLIAFGRADYTDLFGLHHWQTFCSWIDASKMDYSRFDAYVKHDKCGAYNDSDKNLIYPLPAASAPNVSNAPVPDIVCIAPKH